MQRMCRRWASRALALAVAVLLAGLGLAGSVEGALPNLNGKLAFVSFRDGDPEIYTMNSDGSQQTRVTFNVAPPDAPPSDFWPSWSSDGARIVYSSLRAGNVDVYTMNPDGTGQARITTHPAGDLDPAFFPGGTRIAFVRQIPGPGPNQSTQDIWAINTDGTGENLTASDQNETEPAVSPDGTKIAFEREVSPGNHEIFTMNADGTGVTRLTFTGTEEGHPNFSPDGTKIVFDDNFHSDPRVAGAIHTMNLDGTGVTTLTANRADRHGLAAYSPDGTKISFTASEDIWVMNADGSDQRPLTTTPAPDIQASWQPIPRAAALSPGSPLGAGLAAGRCANERRGSAASETITGTSAGDRLLGLGGNDRLNGRRGDDCLLGGDGGDRLSGAEGADRLQGDFGNDILDGASGGDRLSGGSANDRLAGSSGNDTLSGGTGRDKLSGGSGDDRLSGGPGDDRLRGGTGRNRFSGGSGNDRISAINRRRETVYCGPGRDIVRADRSDRLRDCERVTRG